MPSEAAHRAAARIISELGYPRPNRRGTAAAVTAIIDAEFAEVREALKSAALALEAFERNRQLIDDSLRAKNLPAFDPKADVKLKQARAALAKATPK